MERLEVLQLLADRREGDGPAHHFLHRQRRTAAGVAVELGEDHAVEGKRVVEGPRRVDGVLADGGVHHQERVVGLHRLGDAADLVHHLGVDGQPAGGVDDHHVAPCAGRLGQ